MNALHNRIVHDAVMLYDRESSDGTFRRNVMTCFLPECPSSREAIEAFMTGIFKLMIREIDRSDRTWRLGMSGDQIETAIHNGLQFTARVDRRRRFVQTCLSVNFPDLHEKPTPRWPAGLLISGGPRTEDEKIASRLH